MTFPDHFSSIASNYARFRPRYPTELFEVTVAENGETRQYYQWVTKVQRFPVKTVSKQGQWSEEFRHVIFTPQSSFLFELPRRLDWANPTAEAQH